MANKINRIEKTAVITASDLDRYDGTVKNLRNAWEHLPDDIDETEREMFIELTAKVLVLHNKLREREKDATDLN